jgi:hypothetical protein
MLRGRAIAAYGHSSPFGGRNPLLGLAEREPTNAGKASRPLGTATRADKLGRTVFSLCRDILTLGRKLLDVLKKCHIGRRLRLDVIRTFICQRVHHLPVA